MLIRNVTRETIQNTFDKFGLYSEIESLGLDFKIRPKRITKGFILKNMGENWRLSDYRLEGKKAVIQYVNVHFPTYIDEKTSGSVLMGQSDWFGLTRELLKAGAVVRLLSHKFTNVDEYVDWVERNELMDVIEAEIELREMGQHANGAL